MKIEEMPPAQYIEDWLSGYRSSVVEHGWLKPGALGSILSDYSLSLS